MRPLHMLGLMPPEYRFNPPDGAPLMLPGSIPAGDQELILAFFQQVITERPLPRVEVDWYTMLLEPSRRYLEHIHGERGSSGVMLVVKVRQTGVELREVADHPVIRAFEYVAISNVHPGGTEDLRPLLTLTRDIREHAEALYEELAAQLSLNAQGWEMISDFVRMLESPIDVLETVNALIEVQLEQNPPEEHRQKILQRMLTRLLGSRSPAELTALIGLAARGIEHTEALLLDDAPSILSGLKSQRLLRDGRLQQWAKFLEMKSLWEGLFARDRMLSIIADLPTKWSLRLSLALEWVGIPSDSASYRQPPFMMIYDADRCISDGSLARAREILSQIELQTTDGSLSPRDIAYYWLQRGRLEILEGYPEEAESSLRESLELVDAESKPPIPRSRILLLLGSVLFGIRKLDEAEEVLREGLRSSSEDKELTIAFRYSLLAILGMTLHALDKLDEAEQAYRRALHLAEEGGRAPDQHEDIQQSLVKVLLAQGKHEEAEEIARKLK